jgi:methionine synthase II (cobalamin-independent)
MFATLLGGLPRPPTPDRTGTGSPDPTLLDALVTRVVEAQESAGLEPVTDGRLRWPGFAGPMAGLDGLVPSDDGVAPAVAALPVWARPLSVEAWRFAAAITSLAVKQALPGPYSLGRRIAGRNAGPSDTPPDRATLTMALATALRSEVLALADAGCLFVEIEERDAHLIGEDPAERRLFRDAHLALADGIRGLHLSLAIVGGSADGAGAETILAAPYPSLAVDLIEGPDNWRLVRQVPGDRGIVCGALSTRVPADDGPELLLWAAGYAASSNARGRDRVGLATAGSLAGLAWDQAEGKLRRLGEASRLASMAPAEAATHLDPRAIDIRSAAAGRYLPPRRTRRTSRPRRS